MAKPPENEDLGMTCGRLPVPALYQNIFRKALKSKANALKSKCLDCCCFQRAEITNCTVIDCPLWPHRPYQVKERKNHG